MKGNSVKLVDISSESYFTPSGGFSVIYLHDTSVRRRVVRDCIEVEKEGLHLPYRFLNPLQTAFFHFWNPEEDGSALCVAPTSAGKTGLIYLFFSRFEGRKVYLAPTKSLCDEKYREFRKMFGRENVSIRTGDRFEFEPPKTEYVVATYESCLASARSKSSWFHEAQAICIDEVHFLMFGGSRGIFLEELIAHIRSKSKNILALSATVPKDAAVEYANWLSAKLFYSEWRPVPLQRKIEPLSEIERRIFGSRQKGSIAERIVKVATKITKSPKVIIFVYKKALGWKILEEFDRMGLPVLNETVPFDKTVYSPPEKCVVAFHNADIPFDERQLIEKNFREGDLRFLVATQTMAYGVNLPADEALIIVRNWMSKMLPDTSTILQMEGRVGRFGISEKGISRIIPLSGENILKRELEKFFYSPDTRTSLEKLIEEGEREKRITEIDAMTLLVLGILVSNDIDLSERERAIEEIRNVLSYMKTSFPVDVKIIVDILEDTGCIKNGRLTPLGKILASSLTPPSSYREFVRRLHGVERDEFFDSVAYVIRPLLFFRDFSRGFVDMLPPHLKEELEAKMTDVFEEENILELWMMGELWWFFRSPPSQFYLRPDALQLTKLLSQLKFYGILDFSLKDIMKITLSLSAGIHPDFSPFCSLREIGFGRGNAIYHSARELGLSPEETFHMLKKGDKKFRETMFRMMVKKAEFIDPGLVSEWAERDRTKQMERMRVIEKINSEVSLIFQRFSELSENSIDELFDDEIVRIQVFVKLGRESAVEMSRDELKVFLDQDGKVM